MVQIKQGTNKLLYQITDPVEEQVVGLCTLHKLYGLTITKCYTQNNHTKQPLLQIQCTVAIVLQEISNMRLAIQNILG